jgi:hypothetical protein
MNFTKVTRKIFVKGTFFALLGILSISTSRANPSFNFASGLNLNKVPIASGGQNIVLNGSFENGLPSTTSIYSWAPMRTSPTSIPSWNATGGGGGTYAYWSDDAATALGGHSATGGPSSDGTASVYFGNWVAVASQTPTYFANGLVTFPSTPTFSPGSLGGTEFQYGWNTGIGLSQTLTGLTVGQNYGLSFKAGGENSSNGAYFDGVFEFLLADTSGGTAQKWLTAPGGRPSSLLKSGGVSEEWHLYEFIFMATDPNMTISFINHAHLSFGASPGASITTELVLDDVRVNPILSSVAAPEPSTLALVGIGVIGFVSRLRRRKLGVTPLA